MYTTTKKYQITITLTKISKCINHTSNSVQAYYWQISLFKISNFDYITGIIGNTFRYTIKIKQIREARNVDLYLDGLKLFYIWYKLITDDIKVALATFNVADKVLFFNSEFRIKFMCGHFSRFIHKFHWCLLNFNLSRLTFAIKKM